MGGCGGGRDEQKTHLSMHVLFLHQNFTHALEPARCAPPGVWISQQFQLRQTPLHFFLPCGSQAALRMMHKTARTNLHNFRFRKLRAEACGEKRGAGAPAPIHPHTHSLSGSGGVCARSVYLAQAKMLLKPGIKRERGGVEAGGGRS